MLSCTTHKVEPNSSNKKNETDIQSSVDYSLQMAMANAQEGRSARAIEQYLFVIQNRPTDLNTRLLLANEYKKSGLIHLAVFELNEILKISPNYEVALVKLAEIYTESKIYTQAKKIYQDLYIKNPQRLDVLWAIYHLEKNQKQYATALSVINQIEKSPQAQVDECLIEKALIFRYLNNKSKYNENVLKAYALNPRNKKIVLEVARKYFYQKNFAEAVAVLKSYSETQAFDLEISENLSLAAVKANNNDLAEKEFAKQRNWLTTPQQNYRTQLNNLYIMQP